MSFLIPSATSFREPLVNFRITLAVASVIKNKIKAMRNLKIITLRSRSFSYCKNCR